MMFLLLEQENKKDAPISNTPLFFFFEKVDAITNKQKKFFF